MGYRERENISTDIWRKIGKDALASEGILYYTLGIDALGARRSLLLKRWLDDFHYTLIKNSNDSCDSFIHLLCSFNFHATGPGLKSAAALSKSAAAQSYAVALSYSFPRKFFSLLACDR